MDIIERLLEDAIHHDDIATQCDCRPEDTVNHGHAVNARDAAKELKRLRLDEKRLDWLADKNNTIGNVQLPNICVTRNLHSLRAAIDDAMLMPNVELSGCVNDQ